jgi:pyruvate,water dikinase
MDHFGLPRTMVTEGVGGHAESSADACLFPRRFLASMPRLLWFQWCCLRALPGLTRAFSKYDQVIESAHGLVGLHQATVHGLALALRGNFAINAALSGITRVRRFLRLTGSARVVTQDMMQEYSRLACVPLEGREAALDQWLAHYGHRGPLESDLARPRFQELRTVLLADLRNTTVAPDASRQQAAAGLLAGLFRPFFWIDERREWFRDQMMRRWQRLRARILEEARRLCEAGDLDAPEDVFWLRPDDLKKGGTLRNAVAASRARVDAVRHLELPQTASRDTIEALLTHAAALTSEQTGRRLFTGIGLTAAVIEGRAIKADDLVALLQGTQNGALGPDAILVVPTLEPSWAVVFPRVGGVVAELGGELSHASILLREARRPAVVNCAGIFRAVKTGDRLRLDGMRGLVEVID